jgi:TetR/AcrR family transcriptional regulator, regulator of biofilm formation and stress response
MAFRPATNRTETLARREALLDAAITLIGEQGMGAVTHRAIAAQAGLPGATVGYFFASKDELLVEAMRLVAERITVQIRSATEKAAGLRQEPQVAVDALVAVLLEEPEAATLAQFETYLQAARQPDLREEVARVLDAFEELVTVVFEGLGAPLPPSAARSVVALADGFALHRLGARRDQDHVDALKSALMTFVEAYGSHAGQSSR